MRRVSLLGLLACLLVFWGCRKDEVPGLDMTLDESIEPPTSLNSRSVLQNIYIDFFESSSAGLCNGSGARLEIHGSVRQFEVDNDGTRRFAEYNYSSVEGKEMVTLPCSEHVFEVRRQKRVQSSWGWDPETYSIGYVDAACNINLEPNIDVEHPDYRVYIGVTNTHNQSNNITTNDGTVYANIHFSCP